MKTIYSKSAIKSLALCDTQVRRKIRSAIEAIPLGDMKPLQGKDNVFRIRIGKYCVIFYYMENEEEQAVAILEIGSRGDVYK